jgi:hypothetical protein
VLSSTTGHRYLSIRGEVRKLDLEAQRQLSPIDSRKRTPKATCGPTGRGDQTPAITRRSRSIVRTTIDSRSVRAKGYNCLLLEVNTCIVIRSEKAFTRKMEIENAGCSFCSGLLSSVHLKHPCGTKIEKVRR